MKTTQDYIMRAMAGNGSVRIFGATTRNLVAKAQSLHHTTPVATAALGRLLTAAAMMGATLKNDSDILTISIKSDGPLGGVVATTDNQSRVKGYVNNSQVELMTNAQGKFDIGGAVGAGHLMIIKDLGLKEPVSGQVELVSGEIAEDITYYFAASEQTPSSVALGVLIDTDLSVKQAGGYIIQLMPDASEAVITHLEKILPTTPAITSLLESGKTLEDIIKMLFEGFDVEFYDEEKIYPEFLCNCSTEKTRRALINIGVDELKIILEEDKGANIHCHFCNKDYKFSEEDIQAILQNTHP